MISNKELDVRVRGVSDELTEMNERERGVSDELTEMNERVRGVSDELTEMNGRARGVSGELTEMSVRVRGVSDEVTEMNERVRGVSGVLSTLKSRVEKCEAECKKECECEGLRGNERRLEELLRREIEKREQSERVCRLERSVMEMQRKWEMREGKEKKEWE